jgi:adenylate cyclase
VDEDWIRAGLYDPAEPGASERLELLEWIASHGVTVEQMVAACEIGQLNALVGDLGLRPGARHTVAQTAALSGLTTDEIVRIRRASGFPDVAPDEPVYVDADIEMFKTFALASQFFSETELVHFVRVVGGSLRRIAEAAGEMFLRDVEAGLQEGSELDRAKANLAAIDLVQAASAIFEPMFRAHLENATQSTRAARRGANDYSAMPLTVGFVDLNGFTARSASLQADELLELVVTFESTAVDLVSGHGGRLVKLIGDEVMFSAVDCAAACTIAAELITTVTSWGSSARGGLAHGQVITSGGDVYGDVVNLASRIADIAVPGEVLVNEAVTQLVRDRTFEPAGRRQLKGFAEPVRLWSMQA